MLCMFGFKWLLPLVLTCGAAFMYEEEFNDITEDGAGSEGDGVTTVEAPLKPVTKDPRHYPLLYKLMKALYKEGAIFRRNPALKHDNVDNYLPSLSFMLNYDTDYDELTMKRPPNIFGPALFRTARPFTRKRTHSKAVESKPTVESRGSVS